MHRIALIILLSSIERNEAKDSIDKFDDILSQRLSDKLLDRAFTMWRSSYRTPQSRDLDHATFAKSGATLTGEQKSMAISSLKDRLKAPWKRLQAARPAAHGQGATAEQVDHEDVRIPPQLGVDLRHQATVSAEDDSEYLGRLAPFPGVSPEIITPEEAATIRIAGLTPVDTPESLTPRETPETRIDDLGGIHEEQQADETDADGASEDVPSSLNDTPRSAIIDSDIDSDIVNDSSRRAPGEFSDGDLMGDAETDIMDSPVSTDSQIEDNVAKAWRYSHGLTKDTYLRKKASEQQAPMPSK